MAAEIKKILVELLRDNKDIKLDPDTIAKYACCPARYHSHGYITVRMGGKEHYLHRLVFGEECPHVDHINGSKLDCRRENLRAATASQNQGNSTASINNTSGYKGVVLSKGKYWTAGIMHNRKQIHIGNYATPELAAAAYNRRATELFGEYANLNTIQELLS